MGANRYAIKINNSNGEPYGSNIIVQFPSFNFSGKSAIDVYASTYLTVNNACLTIQMSIQLMQEVPAPRILQL